VLGCLGAEAVSSTAMLESCGIYNFKAYRCAAVNFKAILNPSPPQTVHAERCSHFAKMAVIHAQLPLIAVWLVARCL
jgi:hypothetical protein